MKTSKLLIVLIVISGLVLIGSLGTGLYISNDIKTRTEMMSQINNDNINYHIMMILNASDETYSNSFYSGVEAAAAANKIAVEKILIDETDYIEEVLDRLDMAMYAKVDGIIVHAYNVPQVIDKIDQASDMGIPVITLNENLHQSKQISFSGNNRYGIGLTVGKTIADMTLGRGQIAVVDKIDYSSTQLNAIDMLKLGLSDVFEAYDDLQLVLKRQTEQGVLSAETIATEIIEDYPEIDGIYCTDSQSTLGIVQVLIDRNRVHDFIVIGYGDDDEILDYIQTGVIQATIITDTEAVGVASIQAFNDYMTSGIVKREFLPSVIVVDKNNIEAYRKEMAPDDEK